MSPRRPASRRPGTAMSRRGLLLAGVAVVAAALAACGKKGPLRRKDEAGKADKQ